MNEEASARAALEAAEDHLQSLCASHASTFVAVDQRTKAIQANLQLLQEQLANLPIDEAQLALQDDEKLANLSERHRLRRRTLLQHSSLLELVELPNLMDACVRSQLYEDALSIAAFGNTLERRHQNAVIGKIVAQLRARQQDLRRHLLQRLQVSVTMPQCLEVVTSLRRLNSIDLERKQENIESMHDAMETKLMVDFLEARDAWLDATPRGEALLDAIERHRTRLFEIATQFHAIFQTQSHVSASSASLVRLWIARRVSGFVALLQAELAVLDDTAALRDALEASVFLASSMGRLGADFSPLLAKPFEDRMHAIVTQHWDNGYQQLVETLQVCAQAGVATPLQSLALVEPASEIGEALTGEPISPPRTLLSLPPLARFVNAILSGLNELRRCLLPGIVMRLRVSLDQLLSDTRASLRQNELAVFKPGLRGDAKGLRDVATRYQASLENCLEPYLRGSLEAALGNKQAAIEHYTTLREKELASLPKKEEEPAEAEERTTDVADDVADDEVDDDVDATATNAETEEQVEDVGEVDAPPLVEDGFKND